METYKKNKQRLDHLKKIMREIDEVQITLSNTIKKNSAEMNKLRELYIECISNHKQIVRSLHQSSWS